MVQRFNKSEEHRNNLINSIDKALNNNEKIDADTLQQIKMFINNNSLYGIRFDDYEEDFEKMCENNIPVFENVDKYSLLNGTRNNFIIEGDNIHSLTLLQKTHIKKGKGTIDVIYIDPPYNTGSDGFKFKDGWQHSEWLSFMRKRLEIAKTLLTDEGVIFISIDDNEQANLKLLLDKVFKESNFIANLTWNKGYTKTMGSFFGNTIEHILVYANNIEKLKKKTRFLEKKEGLDGIYEILETAKQNSTPIKEVESQIKQYYKENKDVLLPGVTAYTRVSEDYRCYRTDAFTNRQKGNTKQEYEIINPYTNLPYPIPENGWRVKEETFIEYQKANRITLNKDGVSILFYIDETEYNQPSSLINNNEIGGTTLKNIVGKSFDYPKPVSLIKNLLKLFNKNITVLDFFAGSGTTGQSVMELNAEDGGNRHFILCTNNEIDNDTRNNFLYQNGYIDKEPSKKNKKLHDVWKDNLQQFLETDTYCEIQKMVEFQKLGICQSVTQPRTKTVITGIKPDETKYSDGLKENNLIYLKANFVDKKCDYLDLCNYIKGMLQLEYVDIDFNSPKNIIAFNQDNLKQLEENEETLKQVEKLFIPKNIVVSGKIEMHIKSANNPNGFIEKIDIPEKYFK